MSNSQVRHKIFKGMLNAKALNLFWVHWHDVIIFITPCIVDYTEYQYGVILYSAPTTIN